VWKWLCVSIGILWSGSAGWIAFQTWDIEPPSDMFERPSDWEIAHPECRNRFGIWPNGKPMEPWVLEATEFSKRLRTPSPGDGRRGRSPNEVAMDNWLRDVWHKINACEEAQWKPVALADAVRRQHSSLLATVVRGPILALLLYWMGRGLMPLWKRLCKPVSDAALKTEKTQDALVRDASVPKDDKHTGKVILRAGIVAYVLALIVCFGFIEEIHDRAALALFLGPIFLPALALTMTPTVFIVGTITGTPLVSFIHAYRTIRYNHRGITTGILGGTLLIGAALAIAAVFSGK